MNLPKQVQAQAARANEISKQLLGEAAPAPAPAPAPVEAPAPAPAQVDAAAPAPDPAAAAPAPAPAPQAPQRDLARAKDGEEGDALYWLNRYRSLNGVVEQVRRDAQTTIGEMATQIAQLSARLTAQAPAPAPAAPLVGTADDVNTFGQPMVELVQRGAKALLPEVQAQIDAALAPVLARNQQLEGQLQQLAGSVSLSAEDMFFKQLDQALPTWEQINETPQWLRWLSERDPLSGAPRQALLNDAIAKHDLQRTLALFRAFGAPAASAAPAPAPATPNPSVPDLSPAPRTVGAIVTPSLKQEDGPLISRSEIATFYNNVAAGKYRNDPEAKKAMDQKIATAVQTGRVSNN